MQVVLGGRCLSNLKGGGKNHSGIWIFFRRQQKILRFPLPRLSEDEVKLQNLSTLGTLLTSPILTFSSCKMGMTTDPLEKPAVLCKVLGSNCTQWGCL